MSSVNPKTTRNNTPHPTPPTDEARLAAFRDEVAALRACAEGDVVFRADAFKPVHIGGVRCHLGEQVVALYRPGAQHSCTPQEWDVIGPHVREWVGSSHPASPLTAQMRMIITASYVVHWMRDDVPLAAEVMFAPARVEQYVAVMKTRSNPRSKSTVRAVLRAVGLACTTKAPWAPAPKSYQKGYTSHPYTGEELAAYWDVAAAQSTARRRHIMATLLTLGLGAGLRPGEVFEQRATHVVEHPVHDGLLVMVLPDRLVPVRHEMRDMLVHLCDAQPTGRLIGGQGQPVTGYDQLSRMRDTLDIPASLPPLKLARLRTTWAVACLSDGVNAAEFFRMAGTTSAQAMQMFTRFTPTRDAGDDWMLPASGLGPATSPMPGLPMGGGNA